MYQFAITYSIRYAGRLIAYDCKAISFFVHFKYFEMVKKNTIPITELSDYSLHLNKYYYFHFYDMEFLDLICLSFIV